MTTCCENITEATFVLSTTINISGKIIYKFLHLGQYGEGFEYSFVWCRRWFENYKPYCNNNYQQILTPVPCVFIICTSTNKCTKPIYYINILLHNCTYVMLRYVSKSVRHQGAHLFLAKITCMTSVVIDHKTGKIYKIVR